MKNTPTSLLSREVLFRDGTKESLGKLVLNLFTFAFLIVFFLFVLIRSWNWIPVKDMVPTTAVVTKIDSYSEGRTVKHKVYIRYQVEELELESRMGDYFFTMHVGDRIKIFYDQNHPFKAQFIGISMERAFIILVITLFAIPFVAYLRETIKVIKELRRKKPESP